MGRSGNEEKLKPGEAFVQEWTGKEQERTKWKKGERTGAEGSIRMLEFVRKACVLRVKRVQTFRNLTISQGKAAAATTGAAMGCPFVCFYTETTREGNFAREMKLERERKSSEENWPERKGHGEEGFQK